MKKVSFAIIAILSLSLIVYLFVFSNNKDENIINVLGENTATLDAIEEFKTQFELNNNIKVNVIKDTFEVLQQKAGQDLANGTGLYDIILNYNFSLSSYTNKNWVLTKDEYNKYFDPDSIKEIESGIFPNIWKETGYYRVGKNKELKAIGYPFAGNTMLLVYNKDYFNNKQYKDKYNETYKEELSPPKTWEQFRNIAEFFTNLKPDLSGVVLEGASGGWLYYEFCNFLYGMGGGIFDKTYGWEGDIETPIIIDSPDSIKAIKYYTSLKDFNAGDYFSTGQNEQVETMRSGEAVMAIMWSDVLFSLTNGPGSDSFGFSPIPGESSVVGGGIYYINRKSENIELAAKFIEFVMQKDIQSKLMKKGLCSAYKDVYSEPDISKIPYANALYESLNRATYMHEAGPDADAVQEIITSTVQKVWRGDLTVEQAVTKAKEDIALQRKKVFNILDSSDGN